MRKIAAASIVLVFCVSTVFGYRLMLYDPDGDSEFEGDEYPYIAGTENDHAWGAHQDTCAYPSDYGSPVPCLPPAFIDHTTTVYVVVGAKTGDVTDNTQIGAVEDAIETWSDTLGVLSSDIDVDYYGSSTKSLDVTDNYNVVAFGSWDDLGTNNAITLCRVSTTAGANFGEVLECDMLLNDARYDWTDGTYECGTTQGTEKDIQSIVTHELGHLLGMAHSTDTACATLPTMASGGAWCPPCSTQAGSLERRSLSEDDVDGLSELYGPGNGDSNYVKELAGYDGYPSKAVAGAQMAPAQLHLVTSYPNPFNPQTVIQFELEEEGEVSLQVYNGAGQVVDVLMAARRMPAGMHEVVWAPDTRGVNIATGVYVVSLEAPAWRRSHRVTLVR